MHLQENTLFWTFNFDLGVLVTNNVTQYLLHYVNYALIKFEVATAKGLEDHIKENTLFDLDHGHKPLHYVIYVPVKFEVATTNG